MRDMVLIDGIPANPILLDDRAFQYGDGLFETVAVIDGMPCLWDAHKTRLVEGCRRLRLPLPAIDLLDDECHRLASAAGRAVIKLYWTAGDSLRGYRRSRPIQPRRILRITDWPSQGVDRSWTVRLCRHRLGENPVLAAIKHLNRLDQVLARAEWQDAAVDEGIVCGQDGRVVSGTLSNLFAQFADTLVTPEIDGAGVAGVVRSLIIGLAEQDHKSLEVGPMDVEDLRRADALYMTNSLIGAIRVKRFEATDYDMNIAEHPLITVARSLCHRPDGAV